MSTNQQLSITTFLEQNEINLVVEDNVRELEGLNLSISVAEITVLNLREKTHTANQYSLKFENFPTMDEIKFKAI